MAKIKTAPKVVLIVLGVAGLLYGLKTAGEHGLIPVPGIARALTPTKVGDIPKLEDAKVQNVNPVAFPSKYPAKVANTLVRGEFWEWNAQDAIILANGGPQTTSGSFMEKHKVNLSLALQNDTNQMQTDLVDCAKEIHDGATQCTKGANFVVIMGDGVPQFAAQIDPLLTKLGPDYKVKTIYALGYSRGEDALMARPELRKDPTAAKGDLWEGVLRDGDWNIGIRWEGDNNIKNNPDEKTWDPDAVNWVNAPDYITAAKDYVAGKCEDRKVVKDGKPTGETKHVCVNGVVTWTPGDVIIAEGKGGLVKIVSSKEYSSQMPAAIVGPAKFLRDNRDEIAGLIAASSEAADQIKAYDAALHEASRIAAEIYKDQDAAYWYKYFKGTTTTDAQGLRVSLGGSAVSNLEDNKLLFGFDKGSNDNFKSTYNIFAAIDVQQYPDLFKSNPIPDVKDVEDKTFIEDAENALDNTGAAAEETDYSSGQSGVVVGSRDYSIQFDTGKASLTPDGLKTMQEIKDDLATNNLFISVAGYTDNTGNEQANIALSQARAETVKNYLQHSAPKNFPNNRFEVTGHGSSDPIASNQTMEGKAANRRVHIILSAGN